MIAVPPSSRVAGTSGPGQWLGSLFFTSFFPVWTFFYAIFFVIACSMLPYRTRFELARVWARVILAVLRWTCRLDYRVEGYELLPPGNHVALIKHSSSWETVAQALLLPPQVWVLKRELLWVPVVGWGIRQLRAIAVNRGAGSAAVRSVIEQGKARLAEGEWVVIFPEGTRMPPGETRKYGVSGALLAGETSGRRQPGRPAGKSVAPRKAAKKHKLTPEGRKRISEALKRRWAARRKALAKTAKAA